MNTLILPKTHVSPRIVKQEQGDCFAHSITNMFLKYFKTTYCNDEFFEGLQTTYKGSYLKVSDCDTLYLDFEKKLYSCNSDSCTLDSSKLERKCKNKSELNSLLLYIFIYKLIIQEFGCDGGEIILSIEYVISKLYDKTYIENLETKCELPELARPTVFQKAFQKTITAITRKIPTPKEEYCVRIQKLLLKNYENEQMYIDYGKHILGIYINNYNNVKTKLFSEIKEVLDKNLYVNISLVGIYMFLLDLRWKLDGDKTRNLTESEYATQFQRHVSLNSDDNNINNIDDGHSMIIVDYDYSDVNNKKITIKNTWGKILIKNYESTGFLVIHEKDIDFLNLLTDTTLINLLMPNNTPSSSIKNLIIKNIKDKSTMLIEWITPATQNNIINKIRRNKSICNNSNEDDTTLITPSDQTFNIDYLKYTIYYGSWKSFASIFDCFSIEINNKMNIVDVFINIINDPHNPMHTNVRYLLCVIFFSKLVEYKIPVDKRKIESKLSPTKIFPEKQTRKGQRIKKNYLILYQNIYNKYFPKLKSNSWWGGKKTRSVKNKRKMTRKKYIM